MTQRHIFHISLQVADLFATRDFYVDVLGGVIGRITPDWLDVIVWGHQLTFHARHADAGVTSARDHEDRHFGVILPWEEWVHACERLREYGVEMRGPLISHHGTEIEQRKVYVRDPDGYLIELKWYRNLAATFGQSFEV